jgi:hypothetical protein
MNMVIRIQRNYRRIFVNTPKYFPLIGIALICIMAFSAEVTSLQELYRKGEIQFEQEYVLDDDAMPVDLFFESPSTVTCDPEGNIYVVDSGAQNIKKFDKDGRFLKTFGREGQGPGEFGGIYYATFTKDRLIVWDSGNRRLCAFTPSGEFVHSVNIAYDEGFVRRLRGLPSGEVIVEKEKTYRKEPDRPQTCLIDLYSSDLERVRTIYKRELWRKKYIRTKEYGTSVLYFPYSADVRWDVTPDGHIIIGYSDKYELEAYDKTGKKIFAIAHTHEPAAVTEKDKKDYFASISFYRMGERLKEVPEYITKHTEFPKHKPVYKDVIVDTEGNIWVVLNREKEDESEIMFDAFNPAGKSISRVKIRGDVLFPQNRNTYLFHGRSFFQIKTGEDELFRIICYRMTG